MKSRKSSISIENLLSSAHEFFEGEEFEKALEIYEKAIKLGHYQSFLNTAICKIHMFETEKALDDLDKLISKVKPSEKMHFLMRRGIIKWHIERYQEAYMNSITSFVETILEKKPVSVSFDDGRRALILAEAAYKSVKSGKFENID